MLTEIRSARDWKIRIKPYIGRWFKRVGEAVTAGDPLVEIETQDETIEVQAPTTGVLSEIFLRTDNISKPAHCLE